MTGFNFTAIELEQAGHGVMIRLRAAWLQTRKPNIEREGGRGKNPLLLFYAREQVKKVKGM